MDSTVETTYREDGTLLAITASCSVEDEDMTPTQRMLVSVQVARSLLLHAHNDIEMLAQSAPDDASALTVEPPTS